MANTAYINIHTHHPQPEDVIAVVNADPQTYTGDEAQFVSIGIHPWHIAKYDAVTIIGKIKRDSASDHVKAIGECGLDRLAQTPMNMQETVFIQQVRIAEEVQKPLIIHCVKAFDELIRIKKEQKINVPLIIHGYNNNIQIAEQLLKNDCYLSFGKALLNEGSNAQQIIRELDFEKFFLETDSSDISIAAVYEKTAELKHTSLEELKEKMFLNFKKIFHHE